VNLHLRISKGGENSGCPKRHRDGHRDACRGGVRSWLRSTGPLSGEMTVFRPKLPVHGGRRFGGAVGMGVKPDKARLSENERDGLLRLPEEGNTNIIERGRGTGLLNC